MGEKEKENMYSEHTRLCSCPWLMTELWFLAILTRESLVKVDFFHMGVLIDLGLISNIEQTLPQTMFCFVLFLAFMVLIHTVNIYVSACF